MFVIHRFAKHLRLFCPLSKALDTQFGDCKCFINRVQQTPRKRAFPVWLLNKISYSNRMSCRPVHAMQSVSLKRREKGCGDAVRAADLLSTCVLLANLRNSDPKCSHDHHRNMQHHRYRRWWKDRRGNDGTRGISRSLSLRVVYAADEHAFSLEIIIARL